LKNAVEVTIIEPEGLDEVWVQVHSDELLDWPRVVAGMDATQRKVVDRCRPAPLDHQPGEVLPTSPYKFSDLWALAKAVV
jgi:hypothetical protein